MPAFPSPAAYHTTFKLPDARSTESDGPETGQPCNTQWSSLTMAGFEKFVPPSVELATAMCRKLPDRTWRQPAYNVPSAETASDVLQHGHASDATFRLAEKVRPPSVE